MALQRSKQLEGENMKEAAGIKPVPPKLTPKAVISVTGKPSFANVLTFQREALKGTIFKLTLADAHTLRSFRSATGAIVSGKRTDGFLTTEVAHDLGSHDSKLKASVKQAKDGRTLTADYTHFVSKPAGGLVDATVDVMDRGLKLTGGFNLGNKLASLTLTKKHGELNYSAAVNSNQLIRASVTRKRGDTTWGASYVFPVLVSGEYVHKGLKVVAKAPVTQEGVGDVKLTATYEKTYAL